MPDELTPFTTIIPVGIHVAQVWYNIAKPTIEGTGGLIAEPRDMGNNTAEIDMDLPDGQDPTLHIPGYPFRTRNTGQHQPLATERPSE